VSVDSLPEIEEMKARSRIWANIHHLKSSKVNQHLSEEFQVYVFSEYFKEMEKFKSTGRVLDVGCGIGSFVYAAQIRGWESYGIDIGPAISVAKKNKLNVSQGNLEDMDFPENYFDVITMFDVIEHIVDLDSLIKKIQFNLRDNGLLIVKTPNINCLTSKVLGSRWSAIQPKDHVILFSSKTLIKFLQKYKFSKVRIRTEDINIFELIESCRRNQQDSNSEKKEFMKRRLIKKIIDSKVLQTLRRIINFLMNLFGFGESIIFFAKNNYGEKK
jgi:2-polyprenyl-3-methyl-5-hydroxy-6-metoxy-1,4-benzoquinol methylase